MNYDEWEDEVTTLVESKCDVTRSDAQGIVMAQPFVMAQSWGKGLSAEETASLVDEASRVKTS